MHIIYFENICPTPFFSFQFLLDAGVHPPSCLFFFIAHWILLVLSIYRPVKGHLLQHSQPITDHTLEEYWLFPPQVAISCQSLLSFSGVVVVIPSPSMLKCWMAWSCVCQTKANAATLSLWVQQTCPVFPGALWPPVLTNFAWFWCRLRCLKMEAFLLTECLINLRS